MAGEKTEQPTEKRLRDARRKGQVARSHDFSSAVVFIVAIAILWIAGGHIGSLLLQATRNWFERAAAFQGEMSMVVALDALWDGTKVGALALAPLFGALMVFALLSNYVQTGAIFTFETIKPQLNKLNPAEGFKQKFLKARPYIELGKTIIKIIIASWVVGWALWEARLEVAHALRLKPNEAAAYISSLVLGIGFKVGVAFLLIGAADYFLQKFLHRRDLMMTKQEVREEYKETEGNPLHKSVRRQRHREIVMQSLAAAVKRANVVVVNPTHIAVALEYQRETMNAPVVAAKGAELMAVRIRQIAEQEGVPIVRDVPLARALYELEIDEEIPEELYEAVAIVLHWVSQLAEEGRRA
ncbi:MAG: hypothetical protein C4334_09440 [Pyrinomonas sp.]|uniref:EscU/YscU/HrcU family type III secretion system export apparatus switch protein n=1 Tax=Pyrinomonas sp. TaxID=2080306 RepID=UPI003327F582